MDNLFKPSTPQIEEVVTPLYTQPHARIERIVSWGQATPTDFWYDQDEDEWLVLLEGEATLRYDDGRLCHLAKGEPLLIPAHERHQVASTSSPAIWLCVFVTPS